MNRFSIMLAVAALCSSDHPIGGASEPTDPNKRLAPANRAQSKTGGSFGLPIPYSSGCNCSKCDPDDMGYPAGSKHLYRTEGVTKGPKKLSRAQRKAKRK